MALSTYSKDLLVAAHQKTKERDYWLNNLSGEPAKSHFPYDYKKNGNPRKIEKIGFPFPGELRAKLMDLSSGSDPKLYIILAAGIAALLHKYTGHDDILTGMPVFKQKVRGDFINSVLVLRNRVTADITFRELMSGMKDTVVGAMDNRNYPVEILAEQLGKGFSGDDDFPLFDVAVLLLNIHDKEYLRHINHNLTFSFLKTGGDIEAEAEYNSLLYSKATVGRLFDHFTRLLTGALSNADSALTGIQMLSAREKRVILDDFNAVSAAYPVDDTIHRLFEEQASRTPDMVAMVGAAGKESTALTYGGLNEKARQLAALLTGKGVEPGSIAAVMAGRSTEMVVGIFAILKAGGAYLPIDPEYPAERISYILNDCGAKILLSESGGLIENIDSIDLTGFMENRHGDFHTPSTPSTPSTRPAQPNRLAYIIYTSGSTGKPKGVMIEHRSVLNTLYSLFEEYPFSRGDTYLFKTPYVFDVSVSEIFGWFLGGGRLAVLENGAEKEPHRIIHAVENLGVTHINFVPSMFNVFVDFLDPRNIRRLSRLRYIFLAGEALSAVLVTKFRALGSDIRLENLYGPTEATVYASKYPLEEWGAAGTIPIGKPLQNVKLFTMDKYDNLQPPGVPGELCIGGAGLAGGD